MGRVSPDADPTLPADPALPESEGEVELRARRLLQRGAEARQRTSALFAAAARRARGLALARAALLSLAFASAAAVLGALVALRAGPLWARLAFGLLLSGAAAGLLAWSLRSRLQRAGGGDAQALFQLLAAEADAAHDLRASDELSRRPGEGASPALLALVHVRAAARAEAIALPQALPAASLAWPAAAALVCLGGILGFSRASPGTLTRGFAALLGRTPAQARSVEPIVGDLTLTYLYPPYTGLAARTEEGVSGEVRAPKGTQVRLTAQADRDLARAVALVAGSEVSLVAEGPGHRKLSGSFTLTRGGTWRLRFLDGRGRTLAEGPDRALEVLADEPPQVRIESPDKPELEVDPHATLPLTWTASDDYGISQVALVFQRPEEKESRVPLAKPAEPARRQRGAYAWTLAELSLRPGDRITYRVEALDTDAIDGPKRGASATQVLRVFSAAEHHREALARAQGLWEELLRLLADRLEEPPVPDEGERAPWLGRTTGRDAQARTLAAQLLHAGSELAKDRSGPKPLARALRQAGQALAPAVDRTSRVRPQLNAAGSQAAPELARALADEIAVEEKHVLYLQDLLDRTRLDDLRELGKELADSRRDLMKLVDQLRKSPDEATRKKALAEVSRLRQRIEELAARMAELSRGLQDEHLNAEAARTAQKENDLLGQLGKLQKQLESGSAADAATELAKLGKQLDALEQQLQQGGRKQLDSRYAKESKLLAQAAKELSEIEEQQKKLAQKTAQLRRTQREAAQKRFAQKGGDKLARRLADLVSEAEKEAAKIDARTAQALGADELLDSGKQRMAELKQALRTGAYDEAQDQVKRALGALQQLGQRLQFEQELQRRYPQLQQPGPVDQSAKAAQKALGPLSKVDQALRDALPQEGEGLSAAQREQLQAEEREQQALSRRLSSAQQKLSEVNRKAPVLGPQHEAMLREAGQKMGEAQGRLSRGEPRSAQGAQEDAAQKLGQFRSAMEKMAQSGGRGGQGMPLPWGESSGSEGEGGEEEGGDDVTTKERVEIPDAESSRGPAEYRRKLMEAMKQKAPGAYQERVRQYYEELVK